MIEVLITLVFLFSLWVFGRSLLIACHKEDDNWIAMPMGLCLVGLISNLLYFKFGLSVQSIQIFFLCVVVACSVIVFRRGISPGEWGRMLGVLGVFLFLALPAFIGAEQYFVFRGNHWDQFNYLDEVLVLWANPHHIYHHFVASHFLSQDVIIHGMPFIDYRPAVALVLAIILPNGSGNLHLFAFLYVTALWALVFPAACFACKRILEVYELKTNSPLLFVVPSLAYVTGFWGQYIFDINAWSQMAAMPLLLILVIEYIELLQQLADPLGHKNESIMAQYVVTGLLAAASFLFYPENTILHGLFLGMATIIWSVINRKTLGFYAIGSLVIFSVVVLLAASIPDWKGTMGCALYQIKTGSSVMPTWWRYFDRYWLGLHGDVLFSQIKGAVVQGVGLRAAMDHYWQGVHLPAALGCMSIVANLILALTGMFFVTPDYNVPFCLRYAWIIFTVVLAILVGYTLVVCLLARFRVNRTSVFWKAFFLSGTIVILYFLKKHALWSFGKGLTFLSPYLFLLFCIGMAETYQKTKIAVETNAYGDKIIRGVVIIFIVGQIIFGAARLSSAFDPSGIGYNNLTYPSIQDASMKQNYKWDLDTNKFADCHGVSLYNNVDPFYLEYMKQKFMYLRLPYFSSLPVMSYFSGGKPVGNQSPIGTDCQVELVKELGQWVAVKR